MDIHEYQAKEILSGFGVEVAPGALAYSPSLLVAVPSAVLAGAGWVASFTTLNVAMQVRSPDEILGRCLSVYQAITFGGMAVGAWAFGAVADWRSLPDALLAAAVWLLATQVVMRLFAPMPQRGEGVHH